jgi:dihydroorotase
MPNLVPPVTSVEMAKGYRERILAARPAGNDFEPLMTCYLTDGADPVELANGKQQGVWVAAKLYPAHATTNSAHGVTSMEKIARGLDAMEKAGMPLLVHGEVTDPDVDIFDRERVFLERVLAPLVERYAGLKVVMEHITTREAAEYVAGAPARVAATVTAHHLLLNRNALFEGGVRPHHYCLPVVKREEHRRALVAAATSGNPRFFLGTDSAPHARHTKEHACGCAGIYTAHGGIELYAEAFAAVNALDRLEGFASRHGAAFYGLPVNREKITLVEDECPVPQEIPFGADTLVPFRAGAKLAWRMV